MSRRGLFGLGALATTVVAAGCSTSSKSSGGSGSGSGSELTMWIWPEGFDKKILSGLSSGKVKQIVQGGDFKQKLQTTLQAGSGLPSITGIKGEDIAYFATAADKFVDLNTLGAKDHAGDYVDWKWQQGQTKDGKQLGIPIDIGPTALFYRFDIMEKLGLPSEVDKLGEAVKEWDALIELGKQMKAKASDTFLIRNLSGIFDIAWRQSGQGFISKDGMFIGGGEHVKKAWDLAITAHEAGINAALSSNTSDSTAAVAAGKLPVDFGASWHLADLMSDAPDTSGKWHVTTHPGPSTNLGGSFLAIPAKGENHEAAMKVILEILDAKNLATEYVHSGNFPANKGAFTAPEVTGEVKFLGGQKAGEIFAKAAEKVRPLYEDPNDGTVSAPFFAELALVESSKKDPKAAWDAAVKQAQNLAKQNGLKVA